MNPLRRRHDRGGRLGHGAGRSALSLFLLGALLAPAPANAATLAPPFQVSILADDVAHAWRPTETLRLGETTGLLGHELSLSLDPGAKLESGVDVPGGIQAPLRFRTDLQLAVRAGAGLRPQPARVLAPADLEPLEGQPPLLAPGLEFLLWEAGDTGGAWAFARVLDVGSVHVSLELVECAPGYVAFERDPMGLEVDGQKTLSWMASGTRDSQGAASEELPGYLIDRRAVGDTRWSPMGEISAPEADGVYRWPIPSSPSDEPTVHEYRVTNTRHAPTPTAMHVGAITRHSPFGDEASTVAPGSSVDLISGQTVEPGDRADVEVGRASPGAIVLTPSPGVRLSSVAFAGSASGAKSLAGSGELARSWRLPERKDPSWLPGKAVLLRDGGEVAFLLESGLRGRISVQEIGSERWLLRRELSLDDTGLLPRPPMAPLKVLVEPAVDPERGRLLLSMAAPGRDTEAPNSHVSFLLEHELPIGSGDWSILAVTGPGSSTLDVPGAFRTAEGTRAPLLRLRLRHQVQYGPESAPGESFDVLSSGSDSRLRDADLKVALASIASEVFAQRLEARAILEAIGDDARGALEAVAITSRGSAQGLAALEILRAFDERGGGGARLTAQLRVHALESLRSRGFQAENGDIDAWLGTIPEGLSSALPDQRARALLVHIDRAERGVGLSSARGSMGALLGDECRRALAWAYATATIDPDEGVRWLARYIGEIGLTPSLASFEPEGPAWLLAPERRASVERLDFGWGEQPGTAEELRWQLEARPELASLDLGFALARLHASLTGEPGSASHGDAQLDRGDVMDRASNALFDYDARTAELVLRLIERSRGVGADEVLLRAAESLLPGERYTFEAWRSVTDRRLASPTALVPERERIVLESLDLSDLEAVLVNLEGRAGTDIVLAEGSWSFGGAGADGKDVMAGLGAGAASLELRTGEVRIMAAEGARVRLHAGLRIHARNVVLENLVVEQSMGQAITVLDGGHGVVIGGELRGVGTVIHLQHGELELYEATIASADPTNPPATAVRLLLDSRLFARATLFDSGSLFISGGAEVWLDRCVLDTGPRMLVQAQENGRLFVRESLLRGEGSGLFRVSSGVLAGTVIDVPRDPLGRLPQSLQDGGLRVSPRWLHLVQDGQEVPSAMRLDSEPLGRGSTFGGSRKNPVRAARQGR